MENIVDRVRKLLKLSQSENVNEAALAAQRAQELMLQHRIEAADLELSQGEARTYEAMAEETLEGAYQRARAQRWRIQLASGLASAFGCRVYYTPGTSHIGIIGRPSDTQTVRYLQQYLGLEITRLCERDWRALADEYGDPSRSELPRPTVWKNSFRDGAVHAVLATVREQGRRQAARLKPKALPVGGESQALVLVRKDEEQREEDLNEAWREKFGSRGGRSANWQGQHSRDGYASGRAAGGSIRVGGARGALGGSKARVGGRP